MISLDFQPKILYNYNSLLDYFQKWSIDDIGKSYKGGKDIMVNYTQIQEEGLQKLKDLLIRNGASSTVYRYVARMEKVLSSYVITALDWDSILLHIQKLDGCELENSMFSLTRLIESYEM